MSPAKGDSSMTHSNSSLQCDDSSGAMTTAAPPRTRAHDKRTAMAAAAATTKVRTMHAKDHYEMREYNIDVLEDGKDLSFFAKERPYPIYPSKGRYIQFWSNLLSSELAEMESRFEALENSVELLKKHTSEHGIYLHLSNCSYSEVKKSVD
ncbi:hypothetical protein JHK85_025413 [Glycine max]|nr:hypothetical protein JHK85_025413 [Glycine max]